MNTNDIGWEHSADMSDGELLTDLLHSERAAVKQYAENCTESGCMELRELLIRCMSECSSDQFAVFEQMKQRDLYKTKPAEPREVAAAKQEMESLWQQTR